MVRRNVFIGCTFVFFKANVYWKLYQGKEVNNFGKVYKWQVQILNWTVLTSTGPTLTAAKRFIKKYATENSNERKTNGMG